MHLPKYAYRIQLHVHCTPPDLEQPWGWVMGAQVSAGSRRPSQEPSRPSWTEAHSYSTGSTAAISSPALHPILRQV